MHRTILTFTGLCALWMLAFGATAIKAQPCVARFANGDRISGELVSMIDGVVTLETSWAGAVTVELANIASLETQEPVRLVLDDGRALIGPLIAATTGELAIRVDGSDNPRHLALAEIRAINPPSEARFSGSLSLGANIQTGNTEQSTLSAAVGAERKSELTRLAFRLRWIDSETDGERVAESAFGAFELNRYFSDKLYALGSIELLTDEFKDLDLRSVASIGLGYKPIRGNRWHLFIEGGLAYISRDFISVPDEDELTVRLAADLGWKLSPGIAFSEHLLLYPSFDNDSIELRNELSLTARLLNRWSAELTSIFEFESDPPPGIKQEDLAWVFGLTYGF